MSPSKPPSRAAGARHYGRRPTKAAAVGARAAGASSAVALLLLSAACSNGGSAAAVSTPSAKPASASASSADPVSAVQAAVTAAQKRYFNAYRAAAADPSNKSLVAALRAMYTDQSVSGEAIRNRIAYLARNGYVVRPEQGSYYVIENITVGTMPPAGRAVLTTCGYDVDPVIDGVNRAPDGKDIVVDDTPGSARTKTTWVEQPDETWKIDTGALLADWDGENRCPPRPAGF